MLPGILRYMPFLIIRNYFITFIVFKLPKYMFLYTLTGNVKESLASSGSQYHADDLVLIADVIKQGTGITVG